MGYGGYVHANCENGFNSQDYQADVDRFIHLVKNN
jgi:hypothetical protein